MRELIKEQYKKAKIQLLTVIRKKMPTAEFVSYGNQRLLKMELGS